MPLLAFWQIHPGFSFVKHSGESFEHCGGQMVVLSERQSPNKFQVKAGYIALSSLEKCSILPECPFRLAHTLSQVRQVTQPLQCIPAHWI